MTGNYQGWDIMGRPKSVKDRERLKDDAIKEWLDSLSDEELEDRSQFFDIYPLKKSRNRPHNPNATKGTGVKWTEERKQYMSEIMTIHWSLMTDEEKKEWHRKTFGENGEKLKAFWTPERRRLQSEKMKGHVIEKKYRKVNQYDLDGHYIATYDSAVCASRQVFDNDMYRANISRAVNHNHYALGYQWWEYTGSTDDVQPMEYRGRKRHG